MYFKVLNTNALVLDMVYTAMWKGIAKQGHNYVTGRN